MGLLERGERSRELTGLGCSTRGLEKELGQSSTAIRRNIELTKLPEEDRKAIEDVASAKKILERKADDAARKCRSERIILDRETGSLSDGVANDHSRFLSCGEWPLQDECCRGKCREIVQPNTGRLSINPMLRATERRGFLGKEG
jgi:hypothetical protein